MSCRQSNMVTRSKSRAAMSLAAAVSKLTRPVRPCDRACAFACSIEGRVKVVAHEAAVRKCLGHQQGGEADAAADIGHLRAGLQAWQHAVERRQPGLRHGVDIARSEEGADGAEQAAGTVAPGDPAAVAEGGLDLGLAFDHGSAKIKGAREIDRAVLDREDHRLLGREAVALRRAVVADVAVGGLGERPFPHIALCQPGACREFSGRRGSLSMERVEQAQPEADAHRRHAEGASEIAEHLADQSIEFVVVYCGHRSFLGWCWVVHGPHLSRLELRTSSRWTTRILLA